jgi:hypothetical protein
MTPSALQVRSGLLDPLVNNLIIRLRAELDWFKKRYEEAQAELNATKFTPGRCVFPRVEIW